MGRTAFDTLRCSGSGYAEFFTSLSDFVLWRLQTKIVLRSAAPWAWSSRRERPPRTKFKAIFHSNQGTAFCLRQTQVTAQAAGMLGDLLFWTFVFLVLLQTAVLIWSAAPWARSSRRELLIKEPPSTGSGSGIISDIISWRQMLLVAPLPEQRSVSKGASSKWREFITLSSFANSFSPTPASPHTVLQSVQSFYRGSNHGFAFPDNRLHQSGHILRYKPIQREAAFWYGSPLHHYDVLQAFSPSRWC